MANTPTEFVFPTSLTQGSGKASVTAFNALSSDPIYMADEYHPHWEEILEGLRVGDPEVWDLFDVASGVMARFQEVTDRVSYNGSDVLFDGDPIHSVLSEQLRRAIEDGNSDNYTALAKFWEKLESNPNDHSRAQAYEFLATHAFQITPDGDVVGYKGVRDNGNGSYSSTAKSMVHGKPSAFVNGKPEPELSYVTQKVGDVVSMPRSEVMHDPARSCERGLHVATHDYAQSYGTVMEVHVNPRDIVSVPTVDRGEKVRVSKYKVARIAGQAPNQGPVLRDETKTTRWVPDVGYRG